MVRYEMAIYDFKEFLDIEDVAEYLADKGIGNFNTNNPRNCYKLHNFLKELVVSGKLNLVFRYYGRVNLYDENFMNDPRPFSEKIDIFRNPESLTLLFDDDMLGDWLSKSTLYNQGNNYRHDFYIDNRHYFRPYELFEYECNASDSRERPSFILLDDNNRGWAGVEPLFPKAQLGAIFNQPSKADLENKISMLEQQAKMTNDNYKSIEFRTGGVDTCIYIDDLHDKITAKDDIIAEQTKQIAELQKQLEQMPQGASVDSDLKGIEKYNHDKQKTKDFARAIAKSIWQMDVNQQIRTNDMVQHIKSILLEVSPGDLPERDESLANWLQDIKPPHAKKSGRTPKNAPTEIPLTFKK